MKQFGQVDIVVNAAGAARGGQFDTIKDQIWRDAFDLKFMGAVKLSRAAIPTCRRTVTGALSIS